MERLYDIGRSIDGPAIDRLENVPRPELRACCRRTRSNFLRHEATGASRPQHAIFRLGPGCADVDVRGREAQQGDDHGELGRQSKQCVAAASACQRCSVCGRSGVALGAPPTVRTARFVGKDPVPCGKPSSNRSGTNRLLSSV